MSEAAIDLGAYFGRIGYGGDAAPTARTLRELHRRHAETIAFENLDPVLGRAVPLDLSSLERKLISEGRGGYCYEQNAFFAALLRQLGFEVKGLSARVLLNYPDDAITARAHMLLAVVAEGEVYIADVGFGGLTMTAPLRIATDAEQQTPHERFRLVRKGSYLHSEALVGDAWRALYRFEQIEQFAPDYEMANYYVSTHPASQFRNDLIVAKPGEGCRHVLHNNRYAVRRLDGRKEGRLLGSSAEIIRLLTDIFGIRVPEDDGAFLAAMNRIASAG